MIPVCEPLLGQREKALLNRCIDTGWISSEGPFVEQFEREVAARVGRSHGVAVANGSAALDIAVAALGLSAGDEVIMPSFTIISCAAAVVRSGGVPVFVDVEPDTWNMDTRAVEKKITPNTRAVMPVHIYGMPVDMDPLLDLCDACGLKIIEDASQAMGQTYKQRPCGSFGEVSTLSFYPNKYVTTGEGGMVLTDAGDIAESCRSLRNLCFQADRRFVHQSLGWNYRMSNVQAALGVAQMERLDEVLALKRRIGQWYQKYLSAVPGIQRPVERSGYSENAYWVYGIVLNDELPLDPPQFTARLAAKGIGTRPFFWPMHQQPVFHRQPWYVREHLPVSERLANRGLYLPGGAGLKEVQIQYVCQQVAEEITNAL